MATTKKATSSVCPRSLQHKFIIFVCPHSPLTGKLSVLLMIQLAVLFYLVWFKVKLHVKDPKTVLDKKKYVAFWLERYAKKEPGMPLTVVFDMSESGIGNIVSHLMQVYLCYFF